MTDRIVIHVPAVPVAQPRQRHRVVAAGGRSFAQNYTPAKDPVNAFKATVRMATSAAFKGPAIHYPVHVDATFVFPRPKALTWKTRPMPRIPMTRKPDVDNLLKSCFDALNELLWNDDSQVASCTVKKFFAAGDESPHVRLEVCAVTG